MTLYTHSPQSATLMLLSALSGLHCPTKCCHIQAARSCHTPHARGVQCRARIVPPCGSSRRALVGGLVGERRATTHTHTNTNEAHEAVKSSWTFIAQKCKTSGKHSRNELREIERAGQRAACRLPRLWGRMRGSSLSGACLWTSLTYGSCVECWVGVLCACADLARCRVMQGKRVMRILAPLLLGCHVTALAFCRCALQVLPVCKPYRDMTQYGMNDMMRHRTTVCCTDYDTAYYHSYKVRSYNVYITCKLSHVIHVQCIITLSCIIYCIICTLY